MSYCGLESSRFRHLVACTLLVVSGAAVASAQEVTASLSQSGSFGARRLPTVTRSVDGTYLTCSVQSITWSIYAYLDVSVQGPGVTGGYQTFGPNVNPSGTVTVLAPDSTVENYYECSATVNTVEGHSASTSDGYLLLATLPSGEQTNSTGWWSSQATLHMWTQSLEPIISDFSGRSVTESAAGGGPDTCWFPGSAVSYQAGVTGGAWAVGATNNEWGPDYVGWLPSTVSYYRSQGRAPCQTTLIQEMRISRPSGNPYSYVTQTLQMGMTSSTVWSQRAGHYAERAWP